MARLTETDIARIVAQQIATFMATQNTPNATAVVQTAPVKTVTPSAPASESHAIGKLTYIAQHGNGAQLDGETLGTRSETATWYNGRKGITPFAGMTLGGTVDITYNALENGRNRVLTVAPVKSGKPVAPVAASENIAALAAKASVPTDRHPGGCPRCGGAFHGKNGQRTIIQECAQNQYVATGAVLSPHKPVSMFDYLMWLDTNKITVATVHDGSKAAYIGGEGALAQTLAAPAQASEALVKRGPGRPRKTAPVVATPPTVAAESNDDDEDDDAIVTLTGKILKLNSAGTKAQFQPTGKKFMWAMLGCTIKEKLIGKLVTITIDGEAITSVVRAPKA